MGGPNEAPIFVAQSMGKWLGRTEVLRGATLWARPGRIAVLMGRNGSGKTSLLKVAMGLWRPDYGAVHFRGRVTEKPSPIRLVEQGLFFLPDRDLLVRPYPIRAQLETYRRRYEGDLDAAIGLTGIGEALDQRPHQLSGGERRRAELALAFLRRPLVLLADEPLAGVPPADRTILTDAFRRLAEQGSAVVLTGHDVPELFRVADDVTWITAGTTHDLGGPADALRHDQFAREYLGPRGLASARAALEGSSRLGRSGLGR